jgi:two-component system, NarL family, response regulator LiaR
VEVLIVRIKVLLAEDHVITRQGIRRLLEEEGHYTVVGEAGDGEQAVQMAMEKSPDVVIMDISMPNLNGVEAARIIKQHCPTTAILILSAYDDDEYVFALLDAGVAGYLLKTASGDELVRAVESANKGEPTIHPSIAKKLINRFRHAGDVKAPEEIEEILSKREIGIIRLAARGMSNQDIAESVIISKRTVEGHMRSIFNKLGVGSRTEAVIYGLKKGWFALDEIAEQ